MPESLSARQQAIKQASHDLPQGAAKRCTTCAVRVALAIMIAGYLILSTAYNFGKLLSIARDRLSFILQKKQIIKLTNIV